MVRFIVMIFATVFDVLLLIGLLRSNKYRMLVDSFSGSAVKELYGIGFAMADISAFHFNKSLILKLRKKTALIYGEKYAEYYAHAAFAKAMTYTVLLFGILLPIGVMLGTTATVFMLILALIGAALAWNFCVVSISDETKRRKEACMAEFPDMVTKFALLINSGMVLHEAWRSVAYSKESAIYELMRDSCEEMENGMSEVDAIYEFGVKTDCPEIRKFTASMIQGMSKGNSELAVFLTEQAQEMLAHKRQMMLQKGEKAAGKLLIPIGITFIGIILIIGVGAMQSMSF